MLQHLFKNRKPPWLVWLLLACSWAVHAEPLVLRVVTDNNYPPYVIARSDGQPEGY